jgi:hypothetical protein
MLTTRGAREAHEEVEPRVHPGRTGSQGQRPGRVVLGVVVSQVEVGVGAVKDDDVEVWVLLDQPNQFGELCDRGGGDGVDWRMIDGHPAVAAAEALDAQMCPDSDHVFESRLPLD